MIDSKLKKLRSEIDAIDEEIVSLIAKRMDIVKKVGQVKKEYNIPPLDTKRLEEVINSKKSKAKLLGISEAFIERIFKIIHDHSVKTQKKL